MLGPGSRMVAGFLEMDGWDVYYPGANTPHADIISMLKERNAKALLVSVTMGYNIKRVRVLIRHIRADPRLDGLKVVVGGYAFNNVEGLWNAIGADGFAKDADEAVRVVNGLLS
jgi:methanogenic corrinoid protein MtbC1